MKRNKLTKEEYKKTPILFKILYMLKLLKITQIVEYPNFNITRLKNIIFQFNFYNPLIIIFLLIIFLFGLCKSILITFSEFKKDIFKTNDLTIREYEK